MCTFPEYFIIFIEIQYVRVQFLLILLAIALNNLLVLQLFFLLHYSLDFSLHECLYIFPLREVA